MLELIEVECWRSVYLLQTYCGQLGSRLWQSGALNLRSSSHLSSLALKAANPLLSPFGSHLERLQQRGVSFKSSI